MECVRCGRKIDVKNEMWVKIKSFDKGKKTNEVYYHKECYENFHRDKFQEEYNKKMKILTPIFKKAMGRLKQNM